MFIVTYNHTAKTCVSSQVSLALQPALAVTPPASLGAVQMAPLGCGPVVTPLPFKKHCLFGLPDHHWGLWSALGRVPLTARNDGRKRGLSLVGLGGCFSEWEIL